MITVATNDNSTPVIANPPKFEIFLGGVLDAREKAEGEPEEHDYDRNERQLNARHCQSSLHGYLANMVLRLPRCHDGERG